MQCYYWELNLGSFMIIVMKSLRFFLAFSPLLDRLEAVGKQGGREMSMSCNKRSLARIEPGALRLCDMCSSHLAAWALP